MSARDNAHKTLDIIIIIDRIIDFARLPHITDMSEFDFRHYMDKLSGNAQRSLQFDLFAVYEEERKRLHGEQG